MSVLELFDLHGQDGLGNGRPEELTGLYLYLGSAAASYMAGSDIVIDGERLI
jgi:NAD(P)-dependent dehydrogenase (short-subunit alcohol dehydrogenase family)